MSNFTDLSTCTKCKVSMGVGVMRGWNSDGFIYCIPCLSIRDKELSKIVDKDQERKTRKASEKLKASTGNP